MSYRMLQYDTVAIQYCTVRFLDGNARGDVENVVTRQSDPRR